MLFLQSCSIIFQKKAVLFGLMGCTLILVEYVFVENRLTMLRSAQADEQSWLINQELNQNKQEISTPEHNQPVSKPANAESMSAEVVYRQLAQNERALRDQIRQHWPVAVFSDAANWVTYSDDYKIRKWVDYQNNEIKISMQKQSHSAHAEPSLTELRKTASDELKKLLATRFRDALLQDPLLEGLEELIHQVADKAWAEAFVLGELYADGTSADNGGIEDLKHQLMANASLRFSQDPATGRAQVSVPLSSSLTFFIPMPSNRMLKRARQLKPQISVYSGELKVPEDLIFSVIHTESHFNPFARSRIPAYGLMQIVPHSAGQDATRFLYDEPLILNAVDLFQPKKNIEVGTAYLRLLFSHYLKDITNVQSRWYCAVAAYNTGVGNVARAFVGAPQWQIAVDHVNSLTDEQVLHLLLKKLPAQETRDYLKKVMARRVLYSGV